MSRMKRMGLVLGCAAGLAAGCDGGPSGPPKPVPGTLTVALVTPAADDRAILIAVSGPETVGEVAAAGTGGYTVHARPAGTSFRAAVFGRLASGPLVSFTVPDVNRAASYTATVQEVVAPDNTLRASTAGYALTLSK